MSLIYKTGLCLLPCTHRLRISWRQFFEDSAFVKAGQSSRPKILREVDATIKAIKDGGMWYHEQIITAMQGPIIQVSDRSSPMLNFCSSNYLGLSTHPEAIAAAKQALDIYGVGPSAGRVLCGTLDIHKKLENQIATFHGRDEAMLYSNCLDANGGFFSALLTKDDAVLSDELNHASIIDGIRLCKANKYRYKHLNMNDLEEKLHDAQKYRHRLIVTDGVFSMDGDIAPLRDICALAKKYNALVFSDECHATGIIGKTGRGTDEFWDVAEQVTFVNSTLGKALGGAAGGYTVGPKPVIDLLRNRSRTYLFTNSLPPTTVACASKVFEMLTDGRFLEEIMQDLHAKTRRFRERMTDAGFTILGSGHPISPVIIGDEKLAVALANGLTAKGVCVVGIVFPVVPVGKARIRVQISAAHTYEDIDHCVDTFIEVGKSHKVIA